MRFFTWIGEDALTSTSSGNSTQKETSPFGYYDEPPHNIIGTSSQKITDVLENSNHSDRDEEIVKAESPIMFEDTTLGGIGSPLSQSTRFDETYIEEKSIDMNQFEDNFVDFTKKPVISLQPPTPQRNPFDEEDRDEADFGGGTLSGRDPFDDDSGSSAKKSEEMKKKQVFYKKEQVSHRLSSSSEEIIEATIHDDEDEEPAKPIAFFDKAYDADADADFDNSPPLHHYNPINLETGLTPLEEAQRALRANKARHKPSNVSLQNNEERSRQRYSDITIEPVKKARTEVEAEAQDDFVEEEKPKAPRFKKANASSSSRDDDIDSYFETYNKRKEEILEEEKEATPILTADTYDEPMKQVPSAVVANRQEEVERNSPILKRRNSLVPSRISGRNQSTRRSVSGSMRGKRKTRAIPEFYDLTRQQSIRLRAPVSKKKRLSLHRVEDTEVVVELLNGQKIEVACRSDVISRDVFSLIVQNNNINEHVFFGLSFLKDGEHFFIEDHQRIEKFAPAGWKSVSKTGVRVPYVLHLRFKFYPQILDFIKTDITMHELYLQCRRDILEERIQPKRDAAFELAALALQAEFGNRPPPVILDYFDTQHYLPKRFCSFEDPSRLKSMLAELHGHYSGTRISEAKNKYIQICQRHLDFGAHLHRVFRVKPTGSHGASPFDPDTGISLWIGIMPKGIAIYEQKNQDAPNIYMITARQSGIRDLIAEHLWPSTQTLQFDKKRFVIVAVGMANEQIESTFYTDHHSKSSYFVRFAASQHRWMMKMRQWKSTLRHENTIQALPDVIVEGREVPKAPIRQSLEDSPPATPLLDAADQIFSKMPEKSRPTEIPPPTPNIDEGIEVDSQAENFERVSSNINGNDSPPRGMQFDVVLLKDPENGLGLTLVDGNLNGVPGVYVKLVAENGAGMKAGICVGDRLVRVGNESLDGHDRLQTVEFVKKCGSRVPMTIARLDGYVRHQRDVSNEMLAAASAAAARKKSTDSLGVNNKLPGQSRTPPAPRKAANRRQRAVSDFGAIGDALPTLDGDNLINIKAISGLHLDEEDEEKGEYRLPTTSMYAFDRDDDLQRSTKESVKIEAKNELRKYRYARRSNLEIAEEMEEEVVESSEDEGTNHDVSKRVIEVGLERNENGSLGVQIASLNGRVCIKQLTSEPALSHPDIRIGDVLLYVNGIAVEGKAHQEVVAMLRGGGDVVTLGVQRPPPPAYNNEINNKTSTSSTSSSLVSVMLQKKPMGTLGLSLAKRTMSDGIFIRNIAEGSAAASEGTLHVGDRLVSLDGEPVDGLTPSTILEKLKSVQGPVQITITRDNTDR
ncbi:unnamed protein product [Caenorhabditis angaria]|uniref:Uncharacterized protein n=1 Tax=Caenorhabditis angaria TaxID=860376 RepID=A0A9P1N6F0_9PELO|nr:unnamed protein product [Caenorhabditis angaria]